MQVTRHRPCKHHIPSASLKISSHFYKTALMFMCWKQFILVLKSTGTIYVLYPWFPDFTPCGPEKSSSLLVAGAMLWCWPYRSATALHHSLYLEKASTNSFLFPFVHLPLIFSACGVHKPLCFYVGAPLNSFCCWKSGWLAPHPMCSCWVWSLMWECYFWTSLTLVCQYRSSCGCSMEDVSSGWVQEWATTALQAVLPACLSKSPCPWPRHMFCRIEGTLICVRQVL